MGWLHAHPFWSQQLVGVIWIALWLLCLALAAKAVRGLWPDQQEWSRKLVHIGAGFVIPLAWAGGIDRWLALSAAAATTVLTALNHRYKLLPAIEDVGRQSYGTVAYGLSITLLIALFWPQRADVVCAGVLVMAVGDGLAGLVGPQVVSPSWRVLGERRSLAGTGTMAAASLAVLLGLAVATQPGAPDLPVLVAMAALATTLEQLATLGVDNLTVPLAVAVLWRLAS